MVTHARTHVRQSCAELVSESRTQSQCERPPWQRAIAIATANNPGVLRRGCPYQASTFDVEAVPSHAERFSIASQCPDDPAQVPMPLEIRGATSNTPPATCACGPASKLPYASVDCGY